MTKHIENFTTTDKRDSSNTTATWSGNGKVSFTAGQIATSLNYNETNEDLTQAKVNVNVTSGSVNIFLNNQSTNTMNNGTLTNNQDNNISISGGVANFKGEEEIINQLKGNNLIALGTTTNRRIAQSFVATKQKLNLVRLMRGAHIGSPSASVTIAIQTDSGGNPSGTNLFSSTLSSSDFGSTFSTVEDRFMHIDLSSDLTIGQTYWIVLSTSATDDSNYYRLRYNQNGTYGTMKVFNGTSWVTQTGTLRFSIEHAGYVSLNSDISLPPNSFSISFWIKKPIVRVNFTKSFRINEDALLREVFFSSDGTKMFIVGDTNNRVYQYALSTAWDISTASYEKFYSVSQDSTPLGIYFKSDGTKMYIVGDTNDRVYQYSLSTAWDIGNVTYEKQVSVSSQDTSPQGVFFSSDGTKMYIIGATNDKIYQYALSTAWDIGNVTFEKDFSVVDLDGTPRGIFFSSDGTKMYIAGDSNDRIFQFTLSTAWDIGNMIYENSCSISAQDTAVNGVFFKDDGTRMYIVGDTNDRVYQYDLTNNWNIYNNNRYECIFSLSSQLYGQVEINSSNQIRFESATNNAYIQTFNTGLSRDNLWHHICLVSSTDDFKCYVDGVLTDTKSANTDTANQLFRFFGRRQPRTYGEAFYGELDDVAFYNIPLTEQQVLSLYNKNLVYEGLVAYYDFTDLYDTAYYERVTNNQVYTFRRSGNQMRFKLIENNNSTAEVTKVEITYNPKINTSVNGNGEILKNPNKTTYDWDEEVTLTANPTLIYSKFDDYEGDLESTNPIETITIDNEKNITANFHNVKYATSKYISLNEKTIASAKVEADNPDFEYYLDNGNGWEKVTLNQTHTFSDTGSTLRWAVVDKNEVGGDLTKLRITY